jgi:ATP-dependent Clp protease ATP-binding subunit ClpC
MYLGWADKRRMAVTELPGAQRDSGTPLLVISGFGAYRTLAPEAGLHVFELNEGGMGRVTVRVRLAAVPLGDIPAAKERKTILKALDEAERTSTVVRRYREEPPLVRDGAGKWRTGRLDLVLGGEFDLLQGARE